MPDDPHDEFESRWLLEPPAPGTVHIKVAVGSEVELSPEARAALETLMSSLEESEVSGFVMSSCGVHETCAPAYGRCQPFEAYPCMWYTQCHIAPQPL